MTTPRDPAEIASYHAHVYYDPATREAAAALRTRLAEVFPQATLGRWHDVPVGPHPTAMYQLAFPASLFPEVAPFVMLNRMGLTVLLHPESGRPRDDHTLHATWMGAVLPLKTEILRETD